METVGFPRTTAWRALLPFTTLPMAGLHHAAGLLAFASFVRP
jgi:hypothetical protein